ncbi:MAG: hypothetical protein KA015_04015 [Spirochaetes bacterium]|nr:hypothetical protein [Spirochaetota bacterium]
MKKMVFVLLLIAVAAAAGYYFSRDIYSFYVKIYYTQINKEAYSDDLQKLGILYDSGVPSMDEFEKLFIKLNSYDPSSVQINTIGTLYYATYKKDFITASYYFNRSRSGKTGDFTVLRRIIPFFYAGEYYSDIAAILKEYDISHEKELLYFASMSFYKTGNFKEALSYFRVLDKTGTKSAELYEMAGKIMEHEAKGDRKKLALIVPYYEKAYEMEKSTSEYRDNLVRLYLKLGMNDKAKKSAGIQ